MISSNVHTSIDMSTIIKRAVDTVSPLSPLVGTYERFVIVMLIHNVNVKCQYKANGKLYQLVNTV